ncbi:MAG: xylB [Acidimicrobiales bacterium]|nr:xylB [Acidimicrobiales bacterium]
MTVGVDIGTTSVKAVAVDASGSIIDRVRLPHPLVVDAPDHFAHDADQAWRRGPRLALRRLAGTEPAAVAVAAMVPSLTAVDGRGRPVAPGLLYGDARGHGTDGEAAGFLAWLAKEAPDAAGYWPAPAVANHALGGVAAVDVGTAHTSGSLFGAGGWTSEADRLPAVAMFGEPIGRLPSGAVLAAGGVDAMCEQLVAGADEVDDVLVICGTTLLVWAVTATERQVPGLWTIPHLHGGRWTIGGASNAGGLFVGWAGRLHGRARPGDHIEPTNVPVWVPYVRGERTPLHDPSRRAALHDLDLTHGPAAVERAAWEATAFVVRHHLDLAGVRPRRLVATGGGTRVPGWMQALADVTATPVHVAADAEGAARGAAFLARTALGAQLDEARGWARTGAVVDPDPAWVASADERYRRFRELVDQWGPST